MKSYFFTIKNFQSCANNYQVKGGNMFGLFKQRTPVVEQRVKLTWLPNPTNKPKEKNIYIGTEGTVRCVYPDGSFDLQMDESVFVMVGNRYKYKVVKRVAPSN